MPTAPCPCRILYIDDDAATRRLVERDLERHGYTVVLAESGPGGEQAVETGAFDVICLDHYMPEQDGLETLQKLRQRTDTPPVIFVTGSEEGRLVMAALRAGAVAYVIKETSGDFLPLLRLTINDALEREQMRRAKDHALRELQIARDRAEMLAEQRALLIREVNHRIANSLQLITSLTMLQESSVKDPGGRAVLAEVRSRISAIAQVHRRLYTSGEIGQVALDQYLGELASELDRSISEMPGSAQIMFEGTPLIVPVDFAVPLGVILAELVTNAMKYAYPDGEGPVRVTLQQDAAKGVLRVEDDGVGYGVVPPSGTGLGQKVIRAMAETIGAQVERCDGSAGVCVSVRFPLTASV